LAIIVLYEVVNRWNTCWSRITIEYMLKEAW